MIAYHSSANIALILGILILSSHMFIIELQAHMLSRGIPSLISRGMPSYAHMLSRGMPSYVHYRTTSSYVVSNSLD